MKRITIILTACLLAVTSIAFAIADNPGGKFCKNNPTMNTGTCLYYSTGGVLECNTTITGTKDCYGTGSD